MQDMLAGLQEAVMTYGPKIIMALVIFVIAFIVAKIVSWIVSFLIGKTGIGDASSRADLQSGAGTAAFWVTMLIAIPLILEPLGMQGILEPLQNMVDKFLAFLPNLIGAAIIFGLGYIVATVAKKAVTGVLSATNVDEWAARVGLDAGGIPKLVGTLVFVMLIVPIAIAALDALQMQSISEPAKVMLQTMMDAIPNIIGAAIVIGLSYYIAKFVTGMMRTTLPSLGVNSLGEKIGLKSDPDSKSISDILADLVYVAIMLFGLIEGAKMLNFDSLSNIMTELLALGGHILLGTIIIGFGVFIANKLADIVASTGGSAGAAGMVKIAIIVLATAIGLREMGIANDIVTMGFTLLMGAIAVSVAISFGWGGQKTASRLLEKWTKDL